MMPIRLVGTRTTIPLEIWSKRNTAKTLSSFPVLRLLRLLRQRLFNAGDAGVARFARVANVVSVSAALRLLSKHAKGIPLASSGAASERLFRQVATLNYLTTLMSGLGQSR